MSLMTIGTSSPGETATIDPAEVARFARMASSWWDPEGEFRPLHRLNPVRLGFIRDRMVRHFGCDPKALAPFSGLRLLDIGCGGGLIAEPMTRLGCAVTAIDADRAALSVARAHAAAAGLAIDYREAAVEDLDAAASFDVVLALEVVEHVRDRNGFLAAAAGLVRPGGALIAATLNRTAKSFLLAIVGAEYVLRWLPRGTHHWQKFVRPSELAAGLRAGGMVPGEVCGLVWVPGRGWTLARDLSTNYLLIAIKPK
jgi:2-polyprenyl-6-hydroxyphenyl methylase/3-demethylubiquinone-9 3-methyltransferase